MSSTPAPITAPVPRVPGWPLLGNAFAAVTRPTRFFLESYRALGPVFRMSTPIQSLTILAGPEANALLADGGPFDMAATYARVSREIGTEQLPNAQTGTSHRRLRRLLAPSSTAQGLEPHLPRLHAAVARHLQAEGRHASIPLFEALATDLVCEASFGAPAPADLAPHVTRYGTTMGAVGVGAAGPEWLLYTPWMRRSRARLAAFLEERVAARRAGPDTPHPPDLLDALLAAADRGELDAPGLASLGMLPMKNAGIYLARLLGFATFEALTRPDLRQRLTEEVDAAWVDGPPSLDRLRACRTLQGHLLETLRVWPMAICVPRIARRDFVFAGHAFAPGDRVYLAGPVTHFLEGCFPDPERFDPDRYGPDRLEHRRPHVYAPFGLGDHACLARSWSLAMGSVVLAGLLRRGGIERLGEGPLRVWALPNPVPEARFRLSIGPPRTPPAATAAISAPPPPAWQLEGLRALTVPAGTAVFHQGDEADAFYVIREGTARVERDGRALAHLGPGECFGEMGLLQELPRNATVVAETELHLDVLDREPFEAAAVEGELTRRELLALVDRRARILALADALPSVDLGALQGDDGLRFAWVPRGAELITQGDVADRFYVLVEGTVSVWVGDIPVATLRGVDLFGEIGLLEGRPRTATVIAETDVRVLEVDAPTFRSLTADAHGALAAVASERLKALLTTPAAPR